MTLPGLGAKSEEKILEGARSGLGAEPERRGAARRRAARVRAVVEALRAHPAADRRLGGGQRRGAGARPSATST